MEDSGFVLVLVPNRRCSSGVCGQQFSSIRYTGERPSRCSLYSLDASVPARGGCPTGAGFLRLGRFDSRFLRAVFCGVDF
jgi:hypothetical protein